VIAQRVRQVGASLQQSKEARVGAGAERDDLNWSSAIYREELVDQSVECCGSNVGAYSFFDESTTVSVEFNLRKSQGGVFRNLY